MYSVFVIARGPRAARAFRPSRGGGPGERLEPGAPRDYNAGGMRIAGRTTAETPPPSPRRREGATMPFSRTPSPMKWSAR